jgi:PAS domain S-box-containing protein
VQLGEIGGGPGPDPARASSAARPLGHVPEDITPVGGRADNALPAPARYAKLSGMAEPEPLASGLDLRTLIEQSPDPIAVFDRALRHVYVNAAVERGGDRPAAAYVGRTCRELGVPPEIEAPLCAAVEATFEDGVERALELSAAGRNLQVQLLPCRDAAGAIAFVGAITRDVTDDRASRLLDAAVRHLPIGVSVVEAPSGRVLYANEIGARILGRAGDLRAPVFRVDGTPLPADQLPLARAIRGGETCLDEELTIERGDGAVRILSASAAPVTDRNGRIIAGVATYHDATEPHRARRVNELLAEASLLLGRSLDSATTVRELARLVVPRLADWCVIHLVTGDAIETVAIEHVDPARAEAAQALACRSGRELRGDHAVRRVLAGGPAELMPEMTDELLVRAAQDDEHLAHLRRAGYRSAMVVPLPGRFGVLGAITFVSGDPARRYDADELGAASELARRAGLAIENARLYEREQDARRRAEEAGDRTRRLQQLGAALSGALEVREVASIMAGAGREALGAAAAFVWLERDDHAEMELVAHAGVDVERAVAPFARFSSAAPLPVNDVVRSGQPLLFASLAAMTSAYPATPASSAYRAWAVIPFVAGGRGIGAASLSFAEERGFTDDDRALLIAMAGQVSIALERARLYEDRRRVADALRDSEERLRMAVSAAGMGTWRADLGTGLDTRDATLNEILGLPAAPSTATIDDFLTRVHPDDRDRVHTIVEDAIAARGVYDVEARIVRPDGAVRWIRDRGRVVPARGSGAPTIMTGVLLDITDLKEASERAHEESRINAALYRLSASFASELEHEKLVQLITDETTQLVGAAFGAFCSNVDGADGAAYQRYTMSGEGAVRMRQAAPLFAATFRGDGIERLDDVTRDPRFGAWGPPPDGAPAVTSYLAVPVVARSGEVLGGLFFGHPAPGQFTAQHAQIVAAIAPHAAVAIENARLYKTVRDREEELQTAFEAAKQADRRKDEFLAMLGHELRNPLAPIATALQLMALKAGGAMLREREVIGRQVEHLTRLIDDLLDVSRITRGKVALTRELIEVGAVLAKAIEMASPLFEKRMQRLTLDVPRAGLQVDADPVRLAQVFQNLLTNAAKYTPEGGAIEVAAAVDGERVIVRVHDSGIGISPELLPHVFDLFVQGERAIDRAEGGLGLGLTLVKRLVELHDGSVRADSDGPNRGSVFTVSLPRVTAHAAAASSAAAAEIAGAVHAATGVRVLVVDDNADAAEMLADILTELGHEVAIAHDGVRALALGASFRPHYAVLDIGLPVMDGYELARRLRAEVDHDRAMRLIALTGYGQESDRARAIDAGFDHHLVKPVPLDGLLALLVPPA